MKFTPIDWPIYNKPPYFPQWLSRGETKKLVSYDDRLLADIDKQIGLLSGQYDLDTIKGALLDRIGNLVAEDREGNNDELYRILIKLRVLLNTADGTVNNLIKIIKFFYGSEKVEIVPNYPAGLRIRHDGEGPAINFNKIIKEVIAAGVGYDTREIMDFHDFESMGSTQRLILHTGYSEFMPAVDTLAVNLKDLNFLDIFRALLVLDGTWFLDGQKTLSGINDELAREMLSFGFEVKANEVVAMYEIPKVNINNRFLENVSINENAYMELKDFSLQEQFRASLLLDGAWLLDGSETLSGTTNKIGTERTIYKIWIEATEYQTIKETFTFGSGHISAQDEVILNDQKSTRLNVAESREQFCIQTELLSMGIRNHHYLDGSWNLDGETLLDGMILIPLE
jgi:hypothetical protein